MPCLLVPFPSQSREYASYGMLYVLELYNMSHKAQTIRMSSYEAYKIGISTRIVKPYRIWVPLGRKSLGTLVQLGKRARRHDILVSQIIYEAVAVSMGFP